VRDAEYISKEIPNELSNTVNQNAAVVIRLLSLFDFIEWSIRYYSKIELIRFSVNDTLASIKNISNSQALASNIESKNIPSKISTEFNASLPALIKDSSTNKALTLTSPSKATNTREPLQNPQLSTKLTPRLQPQPKEQSHLPKRYDQPAVDLTDRNQQLQKLLNKSVISPSLREATTTPVVTEALVITEERVETENITDLDHTHLLENNRSVDVIQPSWLADEMDILLFRINDLQLALPLLSLGKVQLLDKNLTSLFGQIDWILGLMSNKKGTTRVVDAGKFLNLGLSPFKDRTNCDSHQRYLISLENNHWGLAVDKIEESIRIPKSAIKWRSKRLTVPWFAGTLNDRMCTLLDPTELQVGLSSGIQESTN
jgi:chemotaxis signal transduction protein